MYSREWLMNCYLYLIPNERVEAALHCQREVQSEGGESQRQAHYTIHHPCVKTWGHFSLLLLLLTIVVD